MISRLLTWLRGSVSYLWLVAAAVYLSVLAGQAVVRNYQSQQDTKHLEDQLTKLAQERDQLRALVVYYNTDSYKEKELRRALLLKQKDEKVYALPESSENVAELTTEAPNKDQITRSSLPTWRQWVEYLLKGKPS